MCTHAFFYYYYLLYECVFVTLIENIICFVLVMCVCSQETSIILYVIELKS